MEDRPWPDLERYTTAGFTRGRSRLSFALWLILDALLVSSWLPGSWQRRFILRAFGARIGRGVVIKQRVRVKFPWRLEIGDNSWVGEDVWIDNLADVTIGKNACISQGAYLCTGSHEWSRPTFDLRVEPIIIADASWVAAKAIVGPGVTIGEGAVLGLGSVATKDLTRWTIYQRTTAQCVKSRLSERAHEWHPN